MRLTERGLLHPRLAGTLAELEAFLGREKIPLRLYEGARTPWRQAELYARGRAIAGTKKCTNSKAWESYHQYGLAVDFVFNVNGKWDWAEPETGMWLQYQAYGHHLGLEPVSFEKPHLQAEFPLGHLRRGIYPDGGDGSMWQAWLERQIELWGSFPKDVGGTYHPAAPPSLDLHERPGLES